MLGWVWNEDTDHNYVLSNMLLYSLITCVLVVCSDQAEARRLKVKEARKRRNLRHEEKRKEKDREIMSLDDSSKK